MPEVLYFTALGATAVIALVANLGRFRKTRALTKEAAQLHAAMEVWAETTDWRIGDGSEVAWVELAEHITGLAGFPQDWDIAADNRKRDSQTYAPIQKWVYGTVVARHTAYGKLTVVGCWREESTSYNVFASLEGAGQTSPLTIDLLDGHELIYDGTPPAALSRADIEAAFAGLVAPARLRLLGGYILLHSVGWLTPGVAEERCQRLIELCKLLPRGPVLGPER